MSVDRLIDNFLPFHYYLFKCQSLTDFAKLLVTTKFKFEKTSNGSKKINSVFVKTLPLCKNLALQNVAYHNCNVNNYSWTSFLSIINYFKKCVFSWKTIASRLSPPDLGERRPAGPHKPLCQ
jgi:hypothetical protein